MRKLEQRVCRFLTCVLTAILPITLAAQEDEEKITFDDHVKPIFRQHCLSCHNTDMKEADLDLSNYTAMMQGGGSGSVIEPGDAYASYLYSLVSHEDEPAMPPESDPIPEAEIAMIQKWIDLGALENKGSRSMAPRRNQVTFAAADSANERPAVIPQPARLVQEPIVHTNVDDSVGSLATSPWAKLAAVGGQQQVALYDTETLALRGILPFPEGKPTVMRFSRNGSLLLVAGGQGGATGRVVVFDVISGERIVEVGDELDAVLAADISSDHKLVALGGPGKVVRVYSTETGELAYELRKHTDWIYSLEFSSDGVLLATGDRNGGLFVWEAMTGREYLTLRGHSGGITGISWRSDSNVVASCSEDTTIRLWEMENGGQIRNWGAHGGGALSIEYARDGRILSCGRDRVTKLWNQDGNQIHAFEAFGDIATATTFCDETNRAIAGDWTGEIRVWKADDASRVGNLSTNPQPLAIRLAEAQALAAQRQGELTPHLTAYDSARSRLEQINRDLANHQQLVTTGNERLEELARLIATADAARTEKMAEKQQTTELIAKLETSVPLLQQSATALSQSVAALEDQVTKTLVEQVQAHVATQQDQLQTNKETLTGLDQMINELTAQLTAYNTEVETLNANVSASTARVQELMPMVEPAQQALDTSEAAKNAAQQAFDDATTAVAMVESEIEFAELMRELQGRLETAEEDLLTSQQAAFDLTLNLEESSSKVDSQQQTATTAKNDYDQKTTLVSNKANEISEMESQLEQLTQDRQQLTTQLTQVDAKITALGPVVNAAKQVANADPEDAELAQISQQLDELMATRSQKKATLQSNIATVTDQMSETQVQITDASEQLTVMREQSQAAEVRVNEANQQLEVLKSEHQQIATQLDQAESTVVEREQSVEQLRTAIHVAQGITVAAG